MVLTGFGVIFTILVRNQAFWWGGKNMGFFDH